MATLTARSWLAVAFVFDDVKAASALFIWEIFASIAVQAALSCEDSVVEGLELPVPPPLQALKTSPDTTRSVR